MAMADKGDPELDTAVMGLIVSSVTQDTSQVPLYKWPLMHFLAVVGLYDHFLLSLRPKLSSENQWLHRS